MNSFVVPQGFKAPLSQVDFKPVYLVQFPRFVVKIDGNAYLGESYDYTENAHGATDEASVVIPVDGSVSNLPQSSTGGASVIYPDWTISIARSEEAGNANIPVVCEIWAGYPDDPGTFSAQNLAGLVLRFRGVVDMYTVSTQDNKTTFTCRSLAFPLTSTHITTPFPAQSSTTTVAFIKQQAERFGLNVKTNLSGGDGSAALMIDVLASEFVTGVRGWYIWDLFLQCAQFDDVDIWVDREGTIHYEAASLVQRAKAYYIWGSNCKGIEATHAPQFSKNVQVQVHSWTSRTKTASVTRVTTNKSGGVTTSVYQRTSVAAPIFGTTESLITSISSNGSVTTSLGSGSGGAASGSSGVLTEGGKEKYSYWPKNKTLAQCQVMANQIWRQISMHEYTIKLDAPVTPGNLPIMGVTALLILQGHPMFNFNTVPGSDSQNGYWPREIHETLSPKSGFYWSIDAVNHELPQGAV